MLLPAVLFILFTLIYLISRRKFNYWKEKNIPHVPPTTFLGNYGPFILQKDTLACTVDKLCKKFPNEPMIGAFYGTEPALIVKDPELIKLVTTKDFYYFSAREISDFTNSEVFNRSLFFAHGDHWKVIRQNLTPLFSSSKMKNMFHLIESKSRILETLLDEETKKSQELEVRSLLARFTMESICACAFGVESDVMTCDNLELNSFRQIADVIFDTSSTMAFKGVIRSVWPSIFYGLRQSLFPLRLHNFFNGILRNVFESRKGVPSQRHDFVDLLMTIRNNEFITGDSMKNMKTNTKERSSIKVDDELLASQSIVFFAAGFETSSTTSAFTLFELAKHEDAQKKVLEEVDSYLSKRKHLEFDCVTELPWLEQCVDEALRLYPVLGVITREVFDDYTLSSGERLEKGLRVHLPVYYLHHNPDYFPEPFQYRPERFSTEGKQNMKPYTYLPFGEGPRICIGMRFAKMQMMAGLVTLFKKYRVELADHMPRTVRFESRAMVTQSDTGIFLKLIPREGCQNMMYS